MCKEGIRIGRDFDFEARTTGAVNGGFVSLAKGRNDRIRTLYSAAFSSLGNMVDNVQVYVQYNNQFILLALLNPLHPQVAVDVQDIGPLIYLPTVCLGDFTGTVSLSYVDCFLPVKLEDV